MGSDKRAYLERRHFYLLRFRRSRNADTLERMYESMRDRKQVPTEDREAFEAAADHRRAELASGRLWDKIPAHVWQYVK
ncbi:Hha/YmoA family nucleoid-associated regulatory protein [Serratia ficaria]|uniref:Hha/YmoA family nucleoid-associated regulatory protein n=1 Tax=Serratia ficaria TaxID=61651 RepID=UPI00093D7FE6|nr:Hha/YmoA family nucleoid-associated regulatory protein [Serratia ficaria]